MILSACLLTRNDAANLERVLPSLAGVADEIIVADTGSTDATVATAERLGARVENVGWDDDFSAARNQILAQAKGDWILWINPDEEFDPAGRATLAKHLNEAAVFVWHLRVLEFARPDADAFTETLQPRIFRNRLGIRYQGRLHPHFEVPLEILAAQHSLRLGAADIRLRRHAYQSTLTPDKLRWAAKLLELELRDRPGQLHYQIEYGRTLLHLNDARGHEVLAEAAKQVVAVIAAPTPPVATVGLLLEYVLTAPSATQNPLTREQAKELAQRWFPATPPVLWSLAAAEFHDARFAEAIPHLERLIHLGASGQYDRAAAFEPAILGGLALQNLGICYARVGNWSRADLCFGKLCTLPGFQDKGRQLYVWSQKQRQQPAPTV